MTKEHTSEEIKYRLSDLGVQIGNIAIEYITNLESQIEKMKECANCPVWLLNQTEKNCKDCKYKEALILLRR